MLNGKNVSYALCLYLGLGTARSSARRIPFEVIAYARVDLLHRHLVTRRHLSPQRNDHISH